MSRRTSETYEKMPGMHQKKNCNQIFIKGPALTREILEKIQKNEIGTPTIFGHEFERKQLCVIAGLLLLFAISFTGTILMWFTSVFDNAVFSNLAITDGSLSYEMWRKPSPTPLMKIHIFNYTNVAEFESGNASKLHVQDIGPYVYELSMEKKNIQFTGDHVSYQEERSYKFMPELSKTYHQHDRVIVPNVPMLSAAAVNKHSGFITRLTVSGLLNSLNAKAFINVAAHKLIVGYEDDLYALSKSVLKLQNQKPSERVGLVATNIGLSDDVITVNTGVKDINKMAMLARFNGESKLDHWSTNECNNLAGATDGSMFSPKQIRNKRPVTIYIKEMCRVLPLQFEEEVKILGGKIPAYRYALPYDVFNAPDRSASNQCFCNMDSGACPPQGVFNATPCAFGAPAFISFPHFYNGDPALREGVTGLDPNPTIHKTYADIHPTFGFTMAGKTRFQFNMQVVKSYGISQLDMFEDDQMLPVSWFELTLEDKRLPEDMVGLIFQTTFTVKSVEAGLKYGCLLMAVVTLVAVGVALRGRWQGRERTSSMRPLKREEPV